MTKRKTPRVGALEPAWEIEERLRIGGMPRRFAVAIETAEDMGPAIDAVAACDAERNIVVLAGPVGVGKTMAACWWLFHHGGRRPAFLRASTLEASGRYDRDFRVRWQCASSLVLDDLGCEYADVKGNFQTALDELIDTYSGGGMPLIITTNMIAATFAERYGDRIASRLHAFGRWHNIKGEDRRRG